MNKDPFFLNYRLHVKIDILYELIIFNLFFKSHIIPQKPHKRHHKKQYIEKQQKSPVWQTSIELMIQNFFFQNKYRTFNSV